MQKLLIRRAEARAMLGIGNRVLAKFIKTGQLAPVYPLGDHKLAYYRTIDVIKLGGLNHVDDLKKMAE